MVLINIVYGLIMALCMTGARWWIEGAYLNDWFFWAVWAGWTTAHILQDIVGFWMVKLFNRNKTITRSEWERLR